MLLGLSEYISSMPHDSLCLFPSDAGVSYRNAILQILKIAWNGLITFKKVGFQHEALDGSVSPDLLVHYTSQNSLLSSEVLIAVGMGTVDDDGWIKTGLNHGLLSALYIIFVVVCTIYSTTKDDMGKAITCRMVLGNYSITSDSNEGSWLTGTLYSIDGCCEVTAGGVLEADCHTQATGKGPVGLALSGAGTDTGPAHKLICVLRNK